MSNFFNQSISDSSFFSNTSSIAFNSTNEELESNDKIYNITNLELPNSGIVVDDSTGIKATSGTGIFSTFDQYSLILVCAFLIGLLLIILLVVVAICICKSLNRSPKQKSENLTSNPAYDKIGQDFLENEPDDINNISIDQITVDQRELRMDVIDQAKSKRDSNATLLMQAKKRQSASTLTLTHTGIDKEQKESLLPNSLSSSSSSSSASINSVVPNKPIEMTNLLKTPTISSTIDQSDLNSTLLTINDILIKDEVETGSTQNKYTPMPKTVQQSLKDKKITDKVSMSRLNRLSESSEPTLAGRNQRQSLSSINRLSTTTSRTSIAPGQIIDFDIIKGNIDDLAKDKSYFQSGSEVGRSESNLSIGNSIDNIYVQEMIKMQQESATRKNRSKHLNNNNNIDVSLDSSLNSKRHSVNVNIRDISTNPNLDRDKSESVLTFESEKSCY